MPAKRCDVCFGPLDQDGRCGDFRCPTYDNTPSVREDRKVPAPEPVPYEGPPVIGSTHLGRIARGE